MNDATDLGATYPAGHPSGRIWQAPVSIGQARARVLNAMDLLEANCRDGIDVAYATRILDEVQDDYYQMVAWGKVDADRVAALEGEIKDLAAECAELQAEAVVMEAMRRHLEDGAA